MQNIVNRIVAAYRRTGMIPRRGTWWTSGGVYACGLGVLVLDKVGDTVRKDVDDVACTLGVSYPYVRGFTQGFDAGPLAPDLGPEWSTSDFLRGYDDGRATYRATRRWRARETIRLGLEALGDACAAVAQEQEQQVVTQGITAVRQLVRRTAEVV